MAESISADYLLIDEQLGRRIAEDRGLKVIGTLGTMFQAAAFDLLDFPDTLAELKANNFYISAKLEEFFLKSYERMKASEEL